MPYEVVSVKGGYKVKKAIPGKPIYFSKAPLTKETAEKQRRALYLHEFRR